MVKKKNRKRRPGVLNERESNLRCGREGVGIGYTSPRVENCKRPYITAQCFNVFFFIAVVLKK